MKRRSPAGPGPPWGLHRSRTGPLLSAGAMVVLRLYPAGSGFDSQLWHLRIVISMGW